LTEARMGNDADPQLRSDLTQAVKDLGEAIDELREVVGEAADADTLLDVVRDTRPDVAILDVRMPPTHTVEGLAAAKAIRDEYGAAVGILVLSHHVEVRYAMELLAGAPAVSGICSRTTSWARPIWPTRFDESAVVGRRSIPRSSSTCCAAEAATSR